MIRVGEKVPGQTLEAFHDGELRHVDLRDRAARWLVLLSYPADFTFICPTELVAFAERAAEFDALGAEVMSVSTDSVFAHKAWHDSSPLVGQVSFAMLADPTAALCRALGVYLEEEGVALRGTFIADPDGVVRALELHDNSIGRDASETLRKLQAAQHVREHNGDVCPAGWRPGRSTLRPALALVGRL
jgi:NADH-dependent peroxiredoxin subunit C